MSYITKILTKSQDKLETRCNFSCQNKNKKHFCWKFGKYREWL